jgi:hypothetical protein
MYWVHRNHPTLHLQYLTPVICVPLSPILEHLLHVTRVDLLVLDLEGAEIFVLEELFGESGAATRGAVRVEVVMVEVSRRDIISPDQRRIVELMERAGYICVLMEMNEICHRKDFIPSVRPDLLSLPSSPPAAAGAVPSGASDILPASTGSGSGGDEVSSDSSVVKEKQDPSGGERNKPSKTNAGLRARGGERGSTEKGRGGGGGRVHGAERQERVSLR